ncbi:predicted protein [Naegleria gruberi]|uniref:Predicted protein n=1 Tax=Naegleria gruberi TaxID=5762 RepID=D2UX55_NAEGR|nr:uncharacterized protein NAEGRDRAFT_61642 [Naegleria gruberi]EFC50566.1 predicted protein [Naegleria gruberi]|eukprot:XP_002683310.1 predicted protein [Naegleria gruberi strain NEG-M]
MIFVELDNQPKQNIQYEIVSPIPASSRKKQVERSTISNVATSLEFSTSSATSNDDEKVVIFEEDDDSIFDKFIETKELEKKQTISPEIPQSSAVVDKKENETPATTTTITSNQNSQPSQDSPEIDFDEDIIFSDNEEQHVEKQLFPEESAQKSQESDSMVIDDLSPLMDDILSQSNEEPVKMTDELNEALCTQAVDTLLTRDESSQKEEVTKKVDQPEQSKQSQPLSTPQKSSSQPKSSQEKKVAPVFTPKSSQERKQEQKATPKSSTQEKKVITTPKSSQEKVTTPKASQEQKASQEKKQITTPKASSQEKAITPKSSQEKKPATNENNSTNKPVKQLTPKTPISILSKVKNYKTPNPSQNPREQVAEKSKSTTKKRKRDQLSSIIAKKAIDSLSSSKKKNK